MNAENRPDRRREGDWREGDWEEEYSETGKPMVPATPRDVAYVRLGSVGIVFLVGFAALGLIVGIPLLTGAAVVLLVIVVVLMVRAMRAQSRGSGEAG